MSSVPSAAQSFSFWQEQAGKHLVAIQSDRSRLKTDVTPIFGQRLLLGSLIPAHTFETLAFHRIKNIIAAHIGESPRFAGKINYRLCELADGYHQNILTKMLAGFPLIERALSIEHGQDDWNHLDEYGAVYVHCTKGISRSSSVIIGYLVCRFGFTVENAITVLRKRRSVVMPNVSFYMQLKRLEKLAKECVEKIKEVPKDNQVSLAEKLRENLLESTRDPKSRLQSEDLIPSVDTLVSYRYSASFEEFMDLLSDEIEEKDRVQMIDIMQDINDLTTNLLDLCEHRVDLLLKERLKGPQSRKERAASPTDESTAEFPHLSSALFPVAKWTVDDLIKSPEPWNRMGSFLENCNVYKFKITDAFSGKAEEIMERIDRVGKALTKLANIFPVTSPGIQRAQCVAHQFSLMHRLAMRASSPIAGGPVRAELTHRGRNVFIELGPSEPTREECDQVERGVPDRQGPY